MAYLIHDGNSEPGNESARSGTRSFTGMTGFRAGTFIGWGVLILVVLGLYFYNNKSSARSSYPYPMITVIDPFSHTNNLIKPK